MPSTRGLYVPNQHGPSVAASLQYSSENFISSSEGVIRPCPLSGTKGSYVRTKSKAVPRLANPSRSDCACSYLAGDYRVAYPAKSGRNGRSDSRSRNALGSVASMDCGHLAGTLAALPAIPESGATSYSERSCLDRLCFVSSPFSLRSFPDNSGRKRRVCLCWSSCPLPFYASEYRERPALPR